MTIFWLRVLGETKPEFLIAAETLSRASSTALSGRPTTAKAYRVREVMSVSTEIGVTESRFVWALYTLEKLIAVETLCIYCMCSRQVRAAGFASAGPFLFFFRPPGQGRKSRGPSYSRGL